MAKNVPDIILRLVVTSEFISFDINHRERTHSAAYGFDFLSEDLQFFVEFECMKFIINNIAILCIVPVTTQSIQNTHRQTTTNNWQTAISESEKLKMGQLYAPITSTNKYNRKHFSSILYFFFFFFSFVYSAFCMCNLQGVHVAVNVR